MSNFSHRLDVFYVEDCVGNIDEFLCCYNNQYLVRSNTVSFVFFLILRFLLSTTVCPGFPGTFRDRSTPVLLGVVIVGGGDVIRFLLFLLSDRL